MFQTLYINKQSLGLAFYKGSFVKILEPGKHRFWRWPFAIIDEVRVVSMSETGVDQYETEILWAESSIDKHVLRVELGDDECALLYRDGICNKVLGAGRHLLWTRLHDWSVQRISTRIPRVEEAHFDDVLKVATEDQVWRLEIANGQRALVYCDGCLHDELGPGVYAWWRTARRWATQVLDMREQVLDITGQELMTADKLSLRINLLVVWKIVDSKRLVSVSTDAAQALYRDAQLALRHAVGIRQLETLLKDKTALAEDLEETLRSRAESLGLEICRVGVRDIILPGDMKAILNQVLLAQKEAEANLIRRREETAAARNQANTARVLADNPGLARLRELEALKEILAGAELRFAIGTGQDVITHLQEQLTGNR